MTETWKKEHPTSDIRVRKALNLSVDRAAILKTLFGGLGIQAPYSFATAAAIGYEPADSPYPYDPEGAKALLKEAGYDAGKPCSIILYSFPVGAFPEAEQVVEVVASYWAEVGFDVKITKVPEWGVVKKMISSKTTKGGIYPGNIGGRVWALPITNVLNHSKTTYSHAEIPELDNAIDATMAEIDPEKMKTLAHKTFMTMYNNYLHIPLVDAPGVFAVHPKTVPDAAAWQMGVTTYDFNLEWLIFH